MREFEAEAQRLREKIEQRLEQIKTPGSTRGEMADEASELEEQNQSLLLVQQLRQTLAQVEAARQRLAEGTYGICESCHQPIPPERLKALPYATLCVACQSQREQR